MKAMRDLSSLQPRSSPQCWALLFAGLLPCISGCLVIEKKTLILDLPKDSKEVRLYYVFEGLSVLAKNANLQQAEQQLEGLKSPGLSFFITQDAGKENPYPDLLRFDDLRFFRDPSRKRQLCADRRVYILDRDRLAKLLNDGLNNALKDELKKSVADIQKDFEEASKNIDKKESFESAADMGMGALHQAIQGLMRMARQFDRASIERFRAASRAHHRWIRFEGETIRLVLPVTPECAQRVVSDPSIGEWVEETKKIIEPISLLGREEGIILVFGKSPIRLTYVDPRPHAQQSEEALIRHAGFPEPILIEGRPACCKQLIDGFLAETRKKR